MMGGDIGRGTVFELSLGGGDTWTENVLYGMDQGGDNPQCALLIDSLDNIYGTAGGGSENGGMVFELSPLNGSWIFSVLYAFDGFNGSKDGQGPKAGLVFDSLGDLYGTTVGGGEFGFGTVFELTPNDGDWTELILYSFAGRIDGANPESSLVLDAGGNLYGTTFAGGGSQGCLQSGCGTVFKLVPNQGGEWTETLFRFPTDGHLGSQPTAPLFIDSLGNVYGTTTTGGYRNGLVDDGVVFRITQ